MKRAIILTLLFTALVLLAAGGWAAQRLRLLPT
jgi:hypothetical protein